MIHQIFYLFSIIQLSNTLSFMEKAKEAMDGGKYSEAITMYGKAIEENKNNHIAYFMRGLMYDIHRRSNLAISDYTSSLSISPNFHKARFNRANDYAKMGMLEKAIEDFKHIIDNNPQDMYQSSKKEVEELSQIITKKGLVKKLVASKKYNEALELARAVSEKLSLDVDFRLEICDILEKTGDIKSLIAELTTASSLSPKNVKLLFRVANNSFFVGMIEESQSHLKKCLSLDPDNTECKTLFRKQRTIRKLTAEIDNDFEKRNYKNIGSAADKLISEMPYSSYFKTKSDTYKCRAFEKLEEHDKGLDICGKLVTKDSNNIDARIARANIYINKELYDEAKADLFAVLKIEENNQMAKDLLQKIEKIIKHASRKDYYKILNVSKSASREQIGRSYRKLAKEWHPDRFRDEEKIKIANKKLQDLNAAYQVLTDEEKRKQFDQGIDPLDPSQQQSSSDSQGGHGFGSHGSFFDFFNRGGGGNNFRFTFG